MMTKTLSLLALLPSAPEAVERQFRFGVERPGLLVLIAACWLIAVLWAVLGVRGLQNGRRRALLVVLRVLGATLVAFVALMPSVEKRRVSRIKNELAVVADSSWSMSIRGAEGASRAAIAAKAFKRASRYFEALEKQFRVRYFRFDRELRPATRAGLFDQTRGQRTDLAAAFRALGKRSQSHSLSSVLLVSDCRDNVSVPAGARESILAAARKLGAPVCVALPGRSDSLKDLAISSIKCDSFAFVRTPWNITATITAQGYGRRKVPVTVLLDGRTVTTRAVDLVGDGKPVEVVFKVRPVREGRHMVTVSLPNYADDAVPQNNVYHVPLQVIRDKIRVLQVCGCVSWDERFLRRFLKQYPTVDLISFFILRTPLDLVDAPEDELSLIPFPTEELFTKELNTFDLVIFQNFDYRPYGSLYRFDDYFVNLRRFVKEKAGAFLMIGGDMAFGRGGYANTPIDEISPVDLGPSGEDGVDLKPFRPRLTDIGKDNPVTALDPDPKVNEDIWRKLPPFDGCNVVGRVRKDALALAVHPSRQAGGAPQPIIAIRDVGTGRTAAVATDCLWYWNFLAMDQMGTNRHYFTFLRNLLRWLVHDPSFNRVHAEVSRSIAVPGDLIDLKATVLDRRYLPAVDESLFVRVRRVSDGATVLERKVVTNKKGVARIAFKENVEGEYHFSVARKKGKVEASVAFCVEAPREEFVQPRIDTSLAKAIAEASGGRVFSLDGKGIEKNFRPPNPEIVRLLDKKEFPIWNKWYVYLLLLAILSTEWYARRRSGLS